MRTSPVVHLQHHDPDPVVVRDFIDAGKQCRLYLVSANVDQQLLDLLGIVDALQSPLVIHSEHDRAPARVRQRHDFGSDFFNVDQPNLELDVGIFTSANKVEQISSVQRPAVSAVEFLLEHRTLAPWSPAARSELSAVCHSWSSLSHSASVAQSLYYNLSKCASPGSKQ